MLKRNISFISLFFSTPTPCSPPRPPHFYFPSFSQSPVALLASPSTYSSSSYPNPFSSFYLSSPSPLPLPLSLLPPPLPPFLSLFPLLSPPSRYLPPHRPSFFSSSSSSSSSSSLSDAPSHLCLRRLRAEKVPRAQTPKSGSLAASRPTPPPTVAPHPAAAHYGTKPGHFLKHQKFTFPRARK